MAHCFNASCRTGVLQMIPAVNDAVSLDREEFRQQYSPTGNRLQIHRPEAG